MTLTVSSMTHSQALDFLQRVFNALLDPKLAAEDVGQYFSDDYQQNADNILLDRQEFIEHARVLKSTLASGRIDIERILVDGATLSSIHYVDAVKRGGKKIRMKVIACYGIENNKIKWVDELTHMIEGEATDRDLGSRT